MIIFYCDSERISGRNRIGGWGCDWIGDWRIGSVFFYVIIGIRIVVYIVVMVMVIVIMVIIMIFSIVVKFFIINGS